MSFLVFKYFWFCLHFYFFLSSIVKIVRKETSSSSKNVRRIIKETEIEYALLNLASVLINKNARLQFLFEKLKKNPRDGTDRRNLERSALIRDILKITKNQKITLAIVHLAQQGCKSMPFSDMINSKGLKRKP